MSITQLLAFSCRDYIHHSVDDIPSQEVYINNIEEKMNDPEFLGDTIALIKPGENWNAAEAYKLIKIELLEKL